MYIADLKTIKYGEETCGQIRPIGGRIAGGKLAVPHLQPWIAHFFVHTSYMCGGALITRWHVLSAAHCNHGFSHAVLGDYNVLVKDGEERYKIKKWHDHPMAHWLPKSGPVINDFAIAELILPVIFSDSINPICLPPRGAIEYTNKNVTISGWGTIEWKGRWPNRLRTTTLTVLSNAQCQAAWNKSWGKFNVDYNSSILLCSADMKSYKKDACTGDSGGMR